MEENQVVTGGDPLKDLYNEFNPKLNLAKSYDEFKSTMQDSTNRKAFFDEFNSKLNLANDYNQFENVLGLKKKDGTITSGPTRLPSTSQKDNLPDFAKGQAFAEKGFLMPAEGTKVPERKVKVSANFLQPFLPNVEVGEDVPEYTNIAQRFTNDMLISGSKAASGLANIMRDVSERAPELYEGGKPTKYANQISWAQDPFGKVILGLNGITESAEGLNEIKQMPDTFIGNTLKSASEIAPDIMLSTLMPEAKLAEGASLMQKAGALIFNPFTKYMMVKEPLSGYGEARKEGKTDIEAMKGVPLNLAKGFETGAEMALIGKGSGMATKATMKAAEKAGLTGAKGLATRELANLAYDLVGYAYVSPAAHTLYEEGRLPNIDEVSSGAGIALMFRAKDAIKNVRNYRQLNEEVNNIDKARQVSALSNFVDATPESIADVYKSGETYDELNIKALEAAKKAKESTDIEEKKKAVAQASILAKAANVRRVADIVIADKDNFEQLRNSDLPDAMKEQFIAKAQSVNKLINPIEIEKTKIGNKITQAEQFKVEMEGLAKSEQDPVNKAQAEFKASEADKMINKYKEDLNKIFTNEQKGAESHAQEKESYAQNVDEFTNRLIKGEQMSSPEDLQFYENNKAEIENLLKSNSEKIKAQENAFDINKPIQNQEYAIQEPSTGEILQRAQEGIGEPGSERQRMEPSIEGIKVAQEGKQVKVNEEKITPSLENREFTTSKNNTITFEDGNLIVKNKKGEPLSERASRKALQEYADNFDYSKGEKAPELPSEIVEPKQASQFVIEESNNPSEIAQAYLGEAKAPLEGNTKFQAIAEYGLGRVTTDSYKRFGDVNKMEPAMRLRYLTKEGFTVDQRAEEISGKTGLDITPQDIIDYIDKYSKGDYKVMQEQETNVALQAKDKFKQLTGLELNEELANKILDKELEKATQSELDIIKQDYETAKQLEDAYWAEYEKTDGFTEEAPVSKVSEPKVTKEEVKEPVSENEFLYKGTDEERKKGLLKNLMKSDIPEDYKKGLEEKGLTYKVSNQVEASEAAKAIIGSLGVNDALEIARSEKIDPSVGSAIYAESLNNLWSNEIKLKTEGKLEEARALAKQWSDVTMEYADKLNSKGKWTAQTAYFYKTSPMGFAIRIENERVEQFADWFEAKEKDYKKVFNEILQSEEGQALLKEEVEKVTKAERAQQRQKRDKAIDSFFESLKLKGGTYATIIPPNVWNAAVDIMRVSVKAGDRVVVAVQSAINHIDKELNGAEWDRDQFKKDYESQLNKVTGESIKERDNEKILLKRVEELKRRLKENDFSAEEYKSKRTLSEKEQAAKDEYDRVKELYDEAKKGSAEYIDKKAKQYLDRLRKRLSGISEDQKEEIIRRSIKEIVNKGGLEYDDFKDIVSETIGIKKLSDEQKVEIESLTEQSNIADDLEQKFLDNPTRENIDAFKKAKAKSLEADRKLFEMTSQKADIVGTLKSLITLNYLSASTLIKNFSQNVIYQATVRFPISLAKKGIDQSVYGATYMGNKMFGTKVIKPSISITDAQRGYFKKYREGIVGGWEQMIKGVDEKDYFAKNQYASTLNPSKAVKDLKASMKGELFLTPNQKIDKWIQATLGWQPYAISRGMIYGDKPPRYAAQGAEALQIAHKELGLTSPLEMEAFMISPEKYSYKHLIEKAGLSSEDASKESKAITKRIIDAGAVATFQNENYFNDFFSKIDEWAKVSKEDKWTAKVIKPPVALLKASQLPFVKTPANVAWSFFKIANPSLTMTKSLVEAGLAQSSLRKGDLISYREYNKKAKESFGLAAIGMAITAGAGALAAKGLIRTSIQDDDKAREKAGEGFFGKSNEVNLGVLMGGDDYWVDLSWFGPIGTIMDIKGRQMEDNRQKELKGEKVDNGVMNDIVSTMGYSVSSTLNTLVFDQGAKMVDALRKGGGALNQIAVNNANALSNIILGSTIASMNKAMAPEKIDLAADNIIDQIINNQKQRNVFVTWSAGYPPSKVSIWGEPMPQDKSVSGVMGSMLGFEKGSADKFGAILYNEQRRTGINEFFPPVEDRKIKVNGKDVKITVEEKRDLDTYIGQARKTMISPFLNDKSTYRVFLGNGEYGDFTYSELTAGKNKDGQTFPQEKTDKKKLAALDLIYKNGKEAGFAKFKEKYKQYQDAVLSVEKIKEEAYEGAEKEIFEAKLLKQQ
jgi:hypothetical protein